ncbi:bacterial Ig-like domain-containing protein, partial [Staphylococcus haemolyticus]
VNQGAKWNPLDHVTLYDPKQEDNSDTSKIPVTKDNVKVTSNNGRINADGTLNTSTPGVYNVTYTYEAVYS